MFFKIHFEVLNLKYGNALPINYQYELSSAIYHILSQADRDYATWLHENGFRTEDNTKKFKLFNFSNLIIPQYKIDREHQRLIINSSHVDWYVSFLPEQSTQTFVQGLFKNQIFEIGDRKSAVQFHIISVEAMPEPEYTEEMEFETLSPMCIKLKNEVGRTEYLSPLDVRTPYLLFNGLLDRYKIFYGKSLPYSPYDCKFEVLSQPRSSLILIKAGTPAQTRVRGYQCRFKVHAPIEIMKLIYSCGIGVQNSVGFGCVKVRKKSINKE